MLNSEKLTSMIVDKDGSVAAFCRRIGDVPYTTLKTSLVSNERLSRMPVQNFISVAHGLDTTSDELYKALYIG